MLAQDWTLGLVILIPAVPLMILCSIFETRYARVARRAQDQVGDLTTVVEESVLGIRDRQGVRPPPQPGAGLPGAGGEAARDRAGQGAGCWRPSGRSS